MLRISGARFNTLPKILPNFGDMSKLLVFSDFLNFVYNIFASISGGFSGPRLMHHLILWSWQKNVLKSCVIDTATHATFALSTCHSSRELPVARPCARSVDGVAFADDPPSSVRRNMKHFVALMELSLQSSIGVLREGRKGGRG